MPGKVVEGGAPLIATSLPRRDALRLGAALAGGLLLSPFAATQSSANSGSSAEKPDNDDQLPVQSIEQISGAQGTVTNGVLDISISRDDIGDVNGPRGVTFTGDFEIHGDLYFQPLEDDLALLNADIAVLPREVNQFRSAGVVRPLSRRGITDVPGKKGRAAMSVTGTSCIANRRTQLLRWIRSWQAFSTALAGALQ